jgi:MFS family permease
VDGRPFAAAAAGSFLSGAALMVTLVDVPLLAQTLLGKDTVGGALVLLRFLTALPIGAVIGGWLASRIDERATAVVGFALAAVAYWLVAGWPLDPASATYSLGAVSLPSIDTALVLAGLGLGLVIAPFASTALRAVDASQHGVASAVVVVTRMMGMLIGIAALAAWGLHRFRTLTADLVPPVPFGQSQARFAEALARYRDDLAVALHTQYREIFLITSALCVVGAAVSLALGSRRPASTKV